MRPLFAKSCFSIALFLIGSCNCNKCPAQNRSNGGVVQFDPSKKVTGHDDEHGRRMYREGQVIDFPTGNDRLQLGVIVSPEFRADPRQKEYKVAEWFTSGGKNTKGQLVSANPRLRQIQEACAYRYVNSNDPNFAQTARVELLGNTDLPIVMLTGPDGKIKRDGSGGLLMYGTDLQGINSADDMADYLIAAAEKFNDKPDLVGLIQNVFTPTMAVPASCPSCGKPSSGGPCPDCTPKPQPNSGTIPGKLASIKPNPARAYDAMYARGIGILGACGLFSLGSIGLFLRFKKRA